MSYDLTIRFDDDATAVVDSSAIESFLGSYGSTERVAQNQWLYEPNSSIHVEIDLVSVSEEDVGSISSICVLVPYPVLATSGESALKMCFAIAEHLGWRVFDEQTGDYVSSDDIKGSLAAQKESVGIADDVIASNSRFVRWHDAWVCAASRQSTVFMIIAIALAAVGAMAIVVQLDVDEDKTENCLFWIGLPIAVAIFTLKIGFDAWLKRRRKVRK